MDPSHLLSGYWTPLLSLSSRISQVCPVQTPSPLLSYLWNTLPLLCSKCLTSFPGPWNREAREASGRTQKGPHIRVLGGEERRLSLSE